MLRQLLRRLRGRHDAEKFDFMPEHPHWSAPDPRKLYPLRHNELPFYLYVERVKPSDPAMTTERGRAYTASIEAIVLLSDALDDDVDNLTHLAELQSRMTAKGYSSWRYLHTKNYAQLSYAVPVSGADDLAKLLEDFDLEN